MPTIYDVAARAGVSPATVSRVYAGTGVSAEKRRRVEDAARELNFTPSRTARALRRKHAEVIALIIPDIANPHFTDVARGVEDVAVEAGFSVILCNSDSDVQKEARYLTVAVSQDVAGVIIAPSGPETDVSELQRLGRPVVAIDRPLAANVDAVVMDDHAAGATATQVLLKAGFSRIACVTGPEDLNTGHDRAEGWRAALRRAGQRDVDDLLAYESFLVDGGRAAMARFLDLPEPPDAVVACSNLLGVGALQVLAEHGRQPPEFGVAIIGELPYPTFPPQNMTNVRLPAQDMGSVAAKMLIERMGSNTGPERTVMLRSTVEEGLPPAKRKRKAAAR